MIRIGYDKKIHPYQLQLRICSFPDYDGLGCRNTVTVDFKEGRIKNYQTSKDMANTTIKEYTATDKELTDLYRFFTWEAIERFEATYESRRIEDSIGYYDWAELRYLVISEDGQISDGVRIWIFRKDPIHRALNWLLKVVPFELRL